MSAIVTVVGIGEAGLGGLGADARAAIEGAKLIYGGKRHLAMLDADASVTTVPWSKNLDADIAGMAARAMTEPVTVLASGDPMVHGIGVKIVATLGTRKVRILPAPSSFSLAFARMGWSLGDPMVKTRSIHALPLNGLVRDLNAGVRLLVLSRDGKSPAEVATLLTEHGFGDSEITVWERMGGDQEASTTFIASDGPASDFDNLNTLAIQCDGSPGLSRAPGLNDDVFDHDGTITKREVRALTISALAPRPGDLLWDVGAGNGTVAIEWMRLEPAAHAIAIEPKPDRVQRISANAETLGVPAIEVIAGRFADVADELPDPDAVFLGGGIAADPDMIVTCLDRLTVGGRLVANAVTLPAQATLMTAFDKMGGSLVRIGIARAEAVGTVPAMKPAIDVLQWTYEKS